MYNSFLKKFTKYTPTPEHAEILCKMTDYKVRVDKQQNLQQKVVATQQHLCRTPHNRVKNIARKLFFILPFS